MNGRQSWKRGGWRLLERLSEPETAAEFGVWVLTHPDMRRNARIRAFGQEIRAMIASREAQLLGTVR